MPGKNIYILGDKGPFSKELGENLSKKIKYDHFHTKDYRYKTIDSITKERDPDESIVLLAYDIKRSYNYIVSGSLQGWGEIFLKKFEMVVFLENKSQYLSNTDVFFSKSQNNEEPEKQKADLSEWTRRISAQNEQSRIKTLHKDIILNSGSIAINISTELSIEDATNKIIEISGNNPVNLDMPSPIQDSLV